MNEMRGERLQVMLSPEELALVDDFRFKHRMPTPPTVSAASSPAIMGCSTAVRTGTRKVVPTPWNSRGTFAASGNVQPRKKTGPGAAAPGPVLRQERAGRVVKRSARRNTH
jgi:hypothetical protein